MTITLQTNPLQTNTSKCDYTVEEFLAVPINDVVMNIVNGINLFARKANNLQYQFHQVVQEVGDHGEISLQLTDNTEFNHINEVQNLARHSQIQLLIYLLHLWREYKDAQIYLQVSNYFASKNINRRSENIKRLKEDLEVLSSINMNLTAKENGMKKQVMSSLLKYEVQGRDYIITFGDWIKDLKPSTYTLIHKGFLKYHAKREWVNILLSIKFAQLVKLNAKKRKPQLNVLMLTLIKYFGIDYQDLKNNGVNYYVDLFKKALMKLNHLEEYNFNFNEIKNVDMESFLKTKLLYDHPKLVDYYNENLK